MMRSLFETIAELAKQLPAGACLDGKRAKRDATRKSTKPQTLYATMSELRGQLPPSRITLEEAVALKDEYDVHEAAQRYVDALFGKQNR